MSDYLDKLEYLAETKGLIRDAIESKGVTVSDGDTFRSYADKIQSIKGDGGGDDDGLVKIKACTADEWTVAASTMTHFTSLIKDVDWTEFNKTKRKNFAYFFRYFDAKTLDLSSLDISNATSIYAMFNSCTSLTSVDLSNWDTSNVTNASSFFSSCSKLADVTFGNNWMSNKSITSFDINNSPLSKASILDLANKIADKSDTSVYTGTYKVTLKTSQKTLFTEDELTALAAQFTSKNWTLAWS